MKKITIYALIFVLSVSILTGCRRNPPADTAGSTGMTNPIETILPSATNHTTVPATTHTVPETTHHETTEATHMTDGTDFTDTTETTGTSRTRNRFR